LTFLYVGIDVLRHFRRFCVDFVVFFNVDIDVFDVGNEVSTSVSVKPFFTMKEIKIYSKVKLIFTKKQ
jgi:hypothetical protein